MQINEYKSIEKYNYSYHVGIKCTPIEAVDDKSGDLMIENIQKVGMQLDLGNGTGSSLLKAKR
jgi:hypothetical protein